MALKDTRVCGRCLKPGQPVTINGRKFDGLYPDHGDLLCERCLDCAHFGEVRASVREASSGQETLRYHGPWDYRIAVDPGRVAQVRGLMEVRA